jgi:hypothetical protein
MSGDPLMPQPDRAAGEHPQAIPTPRRRAIAWVLVRASRACATACHFCREDKRNMGARHRFPRASIRNLVKDQSEQLASPATLPAGGAPPLNERGAAQWRK